jgi:hypothetical protein
VTKLVTAYRKSPVYRQEYVDRLRKDAARFGHELTVIEDYRWPGWWCKMALFDPALAGDILHVDLDTIIDGPLDALLSAPDSMMLKDFYFPDRLASGVMRWTAQDRSIIWHQWLKDSESAMRRFHGVSGGGDGAFLREVCRIHRLPVRAIQDAVPGQVCSFKVDCAKRPPSDARLICYHGNPRPHETGWRVAGHNRSVPARALRCPR